MRALFSLGLLAALFTTSCGYETLDQATCPPAGTKLTFDSFGRPFFAAYCDSCHSATLGNRQGAPENYVFETRAEIVELKVRIFARSAGVNDSMPPGPDDPPLAAREKLKEWLACGAP